MSKINMVKHAVSGKRTDQVFSHTCSASHCLYGYLTEIEKWNARRGIRSGNKQITRRVTNGKDSHTPRTQWTDSQHLIVDNVGYQLAMHWNCGVHLCIPQIL